MTSPLAAIDALLSPIIVSANKVREVRDSLPVAAWQFVPAAIRGPLDALFMAVERYDVMLGRLKLAGVVGPNEAGTKAPLP